MAKTAHLIEVIDLIVDVDAAERRPVGREAVLQRCEAAGDPWASRLVASMPSSDGILERSGVDDLLLCVHREIDRLSMVARQGPRMRAVIAPLIDELRASGQAPPYRLVDQGCGTGYVLRWLAAKGAPDDVELLGIDRNPVVVAEANRLADERGLDCSFEVGDAFQPDHRASVIMSSALLHHLDPAELQSYFAAQSAGSALAFVHVDLRSRALTVLGIAVAHLVLVRQGVSRHDGIRSAQRAHPMGTVLDAVRTGAADFAVGGGGLRRTDLLGPMISVLTGVRSPLVGPGGLGTGAR